MTESAPEGAAAPARPIDGARVCAWVKPIGVSVRTYGLHNTWEPVIVVVGRHRRPGKRDWLRAMPARGEGTLPWRKPIAFCAWLFDLLGMLPGDTLVDLFPGTGIVSRAWAELSSGPASATVVEDLSDASASWSDRRSLTAAATEASLVDEHDGASSGAGATSRTERRPSSLEETTNASFLQEHDDARVLPEAQ